MFILSLPPEYGASFMPGSSTANCITSTLQIRAIEQANNSLIQCAVGIDGKLNQTYFPSPAHLLIQGIEYSMNEGIINFIHAHKHTQ